MTAMLGQEPIGSDCNNDPYIVATAPTLEEIESDDNNNDVPDYSVAERTNVLDYIHDTSAPAVVKHNIAEYFATGESSALKMNDEHFKYYLHTATSLRQELLVQECLKWYKGHPRKDALIQSIEQYPECIEAVEDVGGSVHKPQDDQDINMVDNQNSVAEQAVLFLLNKYSNSGQQVLIMDMKDNFSVLRVRVPKVNKLGSGYACCSMMYKDCPYIVISGGLGKYASYIWRYDVILDKWCHKRLKSPRSKHIMAFANGHIYVIGGDDCRGSFEVYNPNCKDCTAHGTLIHAVEEPSYVVYKDTIYIFGGKGRQGKTRHVQCIDTKTNKACVLSNLPCDCSGGQAVVVKNKVFIATGQGHMIEFDPRQRSSRLCEAQPFPRKHFVLSVKDNKVCIFGGLRNDGTDEDENVMYKYHPVSNCWKKGVTFKNSLPVYTSCYVQYSKPCNIMPFVSDNRRL